MTTVNKWRIYCNTESAWTEGWLEEGASAPTTCFNDSGHSVNLSSPQIIDVVSENTVVAKNSLVTSSENSTITPLGADGVFIGSSIDISEYNVLKVFIDTDVNSAESGLKIQYSIDNILWKTFRTRTVTAPGSFLTVTTKAQFMRVHYTNGSSAQTSFDLKTYLNTAYVNEVPEISADEDIRNVVNIPVNRSVITGETLGGEYRNVRVNENRELLMDIGGPISSFGEVKTITPEPQIELSYKYGINKYLLNTEITGNASITTEDAQAKMIVQNTGDKVVLTSKKFAKYYAGQGINARFGWVSEDITSGVRELVGYGTENDGVFIGSDGTEFATFRKKDGVLVTEPRSVFSVDKLDGTGPSGVTIDITKGNVYQIQFQWHGYGILKFYVQKPRTGKFLLFHVMEYTNLFSTVSVTNPVFPFYASIENITNNTTQTMKLGGCAIFNEGVIKPLGPRHFKFFTKDNLDKNIETHIVSFRNRTSINGINNASQFFLTFINFYHDNRRAARITFYKDSVLANPGWVQYDATDSIIETSDTATVTTYGQPIY